MSDWPVLPKGISIAALPRIDLRRRATQLSTDMLLYGNAYIDMAGRRVDPRQVQRFSDSCRLTRSPSKNGLYGF